MIKNLFRKSNNTFLIVGLGNPEHKYDHTRHNVGFDAIDKIASDYDINVGIHKFNGLYGKGYIDNTKVILLKPLTYMNNSGECISKLVNYEKISIDKILVICDDINLPVAKLRLRLKGSAGGHNGLKNIELHLGTNEYSRIKIGIDKPVNSNDMIDYVLGKFPKEEYDLINKSISKISSEIPNILSKGFEFSMNKINN